jgi:excisionase family DNA binding protein
MHIQKVTHSISYSPREVGQILGLQTSSVYALISKGRLASNKIGSKRCISHSQLKSYCKTRYRTSKKVLNPRIYPSYLITEDARFGKPHLIGTNQPSSKAVEK